MIREPLVMICTCEASGRVRGKAVPVRELPGRLASGVGWIPTNGMISALGPIADSPFGALGELALVPDPSTEVHVDFEDGSAPEHFLLGDLRRFDGTPWEGCPREVLRRALAALHAATGLSLRCAFEHEFVYDGVTDMPGAPYSLDAWRRQGQFGEVLTAAIRAAGLSPDSFLPEFGARQFEVTCAPAPALRAADEAIILREMVRASAHRLGHRASFTPIPAPDGTGNGVHIHFSFWDDAGRPRTHDEAGPYGLAPTAASFCAGVLRHLPALVAITAPCPVSYIRLRPNRFAPTRASVGLADRDAAIRVCPPPFATGEAFAAGFNIEFRAADVAACPWLALGALVQAGVSGIAAGLTLPKDGDQAALPEPAAFPTTLDSALDALATTEASRAWLGPTLHAAYLRHKRQELRLVAALDEGERCALYANAY